MCWPWRLVPDSVSTEALDLGEYADDEVATGKRRGKTTALADVTLVQALGLRGGTDELGAVEILMRAATASLLNSCFHETLGHGIGDDGDVWPYTVDDVIDDTSAALASSERDEIIDQAGTFDVRNNGFHTIDWSTWTGDVGSQPA